jgi:hypothetical protein
MDLRKRQYDDVDWVHMDSVMDFWRACEHVQVASYSMNGEEYLD